MSVTRMCETENGTWLIGSHEADWSYKPLITRQYVLRSEDRGKTWTILPNPRHGGWYVPSFNRMDEGRPISLGGSKVLMLLRTPEGHLWSTRSLDDGLTWTDPVPTSLIHPDAPAMVFHLSDGKTLVVFHHNRCSDRTYTGLDGSKEELMKDRSEVWVSLSKDEGETWSEPRFLFANALYPNMPNPWYSYQCSYLDMFLDGDMINMFVPHRWQRVCHLQFSEQELFNLPGVKDLSI